jgi:hypothetical protein
LKEMIANFCKTSTKKDIGERPKNKSNIKQNEISSMNEW